MGIDFSHGDAHWSYSGFNHFREHLAREIGMDLSSMQGFDGDIPFSNFTDDILPLLNHSDCDGDLSPQECAKIAPRLRDLIQKWPDDDYDKQRGMMLAEGMEKATQRKERFRFE